MAMSSAMIHGLLPAFLVTVLGVSVLSVGAIEGIAEATTSFVKIFSGRLSDGLGRRKVLVVLGYALSAVPNCFSLLRRLPRRFWPPARSIGSEKAFATLRGMPYWRM